MSPTISSMMRQPVTTVGMDDSVASVEALFAERRLQWAPVVDAGARVLGVISATDLIQFHARQGDPARTLAWQLCTYKPIVAESEDSIVEVARQMLERGIHHVVVIDEDAVVGVVSSLDFVRRVVSEEAGARAGA